VETRLGAIAQIAQLYSHDPQAVPALVKRLKDGDRTVRLAVVLVLGKIRTRSEEVMEGLRGCLADEDATVRKQAQDTLDKLK